MSLSIPTWLFKSCFCKSSFFPSNRNYIQILSDLKDERTRALHPWQWLAACSLSSKSHVPCFGSLCSNRTQSNVLNWTLVVGLIINPRNISWQVVCPRHKIQLDLVENNKTTFKTGSLMSMNIHLYSYLDNQLYYNVSLFCSWMNLIVYPAQVYTKLIKRIALASSILGATNV